MNENDTNYLDGIIGWTGEWRARLALIFVRATPVKFYIRQVIIGKDRIMIVITLIRSGVFSLCVMALAMISVSCDSEPEDSASNDVNIPKTSYSNINIKRVNPMQDNTIKPANEILIRDFKSEVVQKYTTCVYPPKGSPLSVILPPAEFSKVVEAGKPIVQDLLVLLSDNNKYIRLAALSALTRITNKRFGSLEDFYYDQENNIINRALRRRLYRYFSPPATASGRNCGISLRYNDHHFGSHSCDGLPI